jgi:hypothetical protein
VKLETRERFVAACMGLTLRCNRTLDFKVTIPMKNPTFEDGECRHDTDATHNC